MIDDAPTAIVPSVSDPPTTIAPRQIGKYRIDSTIGEGSMGVVYRAHDPSIERTVAIKVIRSGAVTAETRSDFINRFRREAQAAGRLNHPNIVAVHAYSESGNDAYIVMEYVEGRSLEAILGAGESFDLDASLAILRQILAALDHAHGKGVIHRDVKPANILLTSDGRVKLTDFGIARLEDAGLTQSGAVLGTPSYMSPEQVQGQPVQPTSDLYSAAVVLYELLTRDRPFVGSASTVMQKIVNVVPIKASLLNVTVPQWLDSVLERAMAKRPEDRFQTAREFAAAVQAARQGAAAPTGSASATFGPGAGTVAPRRRDRRWALIGSVAAVALIAAVAGLWALGGFDSGAEGQAWAAAERTATLAAYESYLGQHPDGSHAIEAARRIGSLRAVAEQRAWDEAVRAGTADAYRAFLQSYSDGPHAGDARQRLSSAEHGAPPAPTPPPPQASNPPPRTAPVPPATPTASTTPAPVPPVATPDTPPPAVPVPAPSPAAAAEAARQAELQAWTAANQAGTIDGYRTYLQAHADGVHATQASQRINDLRAREQAEAGRQADQRAWEAALAANTPDAFTDYLRTQPGGAHADEARRRIAEAEALRRADQAAWDLAAQVGTAEAFRRYLAQFPNGRSRDEAERRLAALPPEQPPPATTPPDATPTAATGEATPPATAASPAYSPTELQAIETAWTLPDHQRIQDALRRLGHYAGPADGAFGAQTRTAIRAFQTYQRAEPTGFLTPEQRDRLIAEADQLDRLLTVPAAAPRSGLAATSIQGGAQRYAHAWEVSGNGRNYQDPEAVYWFRLAGNDGQSQALAVLGYLHANGITVNRDAAAAMMLWRAAGTRGNAVALYNLGLLFQRGTGVPVDLDAARHWYRLSAQLGDEQAQRALDQLGTP